MDKFKNLKVLKKCKSVALISHISPDADALCSMVIMQQFLMQKFGVKKVDIFAEFNSLPNEFLEILEVVEINPMPLKYDAAIIMDCPNEDRVGIYKQIYNQAKIKINIDHHATNNFKNCLHYFDIVSSTCEIVYLICKHFKYNLTTNQLAKIYIGILTDTAGFSVGAINSTTMKIIGACVDKIDFTTLYSHYYNSNTLLNQQVYSKVIGNVATKASDNYLITYITKSELDLLKATVDDTFGVSNQLNTICSAKLICFIYPKNEGQYVSLRCKPGFDVSVIAKKFDGGGHVGAAAYLSNKTVKEIIKEIENEFKVQLTLTNITKKNIFK